jgi:hypothetical protein
VEILGKDWGKPSQAPDVPEDDPAPLDEPTDLLEQDPKPAKRQGRSKSNASVSHKATAAEKRQIKDALTLIQLTVGGGLQFRDPHCGGAILENADNVAEKAVPIIARNPKWVEWFCGSAGWLDVFGLLMALRPVLGTFWGHHVNHSVGGDGHGDDGTDFSQFEAPDLA